MQATSKISSLLLAVAICACTSSRDASVGDVPASSPVEVAPGAFTSHWSYAVGAGGDDYGISVTPLPDGDVLLLGRVRGESSLGGVPVSTSPSNGGTLLARIAGTEGGVVWTRSYNELGVLAVDTVESGQIYMVAHSNPVEYTIDGISIPASSSLLIIASEDGTLTSVSPIAPGSFAESISLSPSGDVFVAGTWKGPSGPGVSIDAAPPEANDLSHGFVERYTNEGTLLWRKEFASAANDSISAIEASATGVIITGIFGASEFAAPPLLVDGHALENPGRAGAFVISLDGNGHWEWGHALGGPDNEQIYDVALGENGTVHIAGVFRGTAALPTGEVATTAPNGDGFVLEIAEDGTPLSHTVIGSPDGAIVTSVSAGPNGVYLAGNFDGEYLRVGDLQVTARPQGTFSSNDMFVIHLGPSRAVQWMRVFTGQEDNDHENATGIALINDHQVALTGYFMGLNQPGHLDLGGPVLEGHRDSDLFVGLLTLSTEIP